MIDVNNVSNPLPLILHKTYRDTNYLVLYTIIVRSNRGVTKVYDLARELVPWDAAVVIPWGR